MAKLILGIAGEMASGKGTIAKYIVEKKNGGAHRFSTMLRDVLNRLYLENSRENLAQLSTIIRQNFGEDALSNVMMHDAEGDEHELVVIDGVRRMTDISHLKHLPHFKLVYAEADMKIRYDRITQRGENSDDIQKTFEEFQKDHEHEAELQIRELKDKANYVINNDGSLEQLYKQIDDILKENI